MTLETLKKAWYAPAVFVFGNDASAKQAFVSWRKQKARREEYRVEIQKPAFIKASTSR
ncbi:MAG: hypothetical protein LBD15_04555 [Holosporales bacterium]|jgi:hypothetical protein|nr:hypothetical protein [Holosporales bacterium]